MKALALLSGGLDSILAIKVLQEQGIEVEAINFTSPFCLCGGRKSGCSAASSAAAGLGVILHRETCGQNYLDMIAHPRYGYGKNMNPCLDCRIFKISRARAVMESIGASFLVTGEVLDQRPMSQRRDTLDIIERDTGLRGLILRPLSARLLRPTIPEQEGWVDREKLLAIKGRGRQPQFRLARDLGVNDYPCPAGGCMLTFAEFAAKIRDLLDHGGRLTAAGVSLLRIGRHFRLPGGIKLVVGKCEEDNERLEARSSEDFVRFESTLGPGPVALAQGNLDPEALELCARIVARYSDALPDGRLHRIECRRSDGSKQELVVEPMADPIIRQWLIPA